MWPHAAPAPALSPSLPPAGKPLYMSKIADIPLTVDCFRYYAGWADKIQVRR